MEVIYSKIKDKIRRKLYDVLLSRYGYGNRVSKSTWNIQFEEGFWDYLYSKEEEAHYEQIVAFKNLHHPDGKILDVGCGQGVLYHYLKKELETISYLGIDIADNAVKNAKLVHGTDSFVQLDFERQKLDEKFDVIIFNETLYYFNNPLRKLSSTIKNNLNADGIVIISMCDYKGHDKIWEKISGKYNPLCIKEISNLKGQAWVVGLFKP